MQQATESSVAHLATLRRLGNNINIFWRVIVYAGVLLALLGIWVNDHAFYTTARGLTSVVLAACFLVTYAYGTRWITGCNPDSYWKIRISTGRSIYPWRAITLWAALLLLSIALVTLHEGFVWLLWIPFGISFSLLPMPWGLALIVPTALLAMGYYHMLPASLSPKDLLSFAGTALGFTAYSFVVYMPIVLLRHRFQRERMFLQLAQSHHDLEEAHQRLAQAAMQERELAVLRERSRLARDLHDTLGHSLALIAVKLEAAQRLRVVDSARADHEIAATQTIARGALAELRASIANLRAPGAGDSHECLDALRRAAEESATRAGWRLTCEIAPDIEPMNQQVCETLLRTGIEALANIERHAEAHSVHLTLARQGDTVILCIEDDGVGILTTNPPRRVEAAAGRSGTQDRDSGDTMASESGSASIITSPVGHYGITGMRERMLGAGGTFTISAGENGQGTRIEARLPAGNER